jgi:hypothetical protein
MLNSGTQSYSEDIYIYIYICTTYEQVVIGMIARNPHLFHYFLWEYPFLFMPTSIGTQLGHKRTATCIYARVCICNVALFFLSI